MTVYTIAQQKGGSGKTALAADLALYLAREGRKTLAIDMDPQGTLSRRLGWTPDIEVPGTTTDVLSGAMSAQDAAIPSPTVPGVDVLVADADLADHDEDRKIVRRWWDHLAKTNRWDAVVIDTAPNLKTGTLAALVAADVLAVPAKTAGETLDAMTDLGDLVAVAATIRPGRRVDFVVPNEHDSRRGGSVRVLADLRAVFGDRVTEPVRASGVVPDAYEVGMPTSAFARSRPVARDLQAACARIAAHR